MLLNSSVIFAIFTYKHKTKTFPPFIIHAYIYNLKNSIHYVTQGRRGTKLLTTLTDTISVHQLNKREQYYAQYNNYSTKLYIRIQQPQDYPTFVLFLHVQPPITALLSPMTPSR